MEPWIKQTTQTTQTTVGIQLSTRVIGLGTTQLSMKAT